MKITNKKSSNNFHISFKEIKYHTKLNSLINYKGTKLSRYINKHKVKGVVFKFTYGYSRNFLYKNKLGQERRGPEYFTFAQKLPFGVPINKKNIMEFAFDFLTERFQEWLIKYADASDFYWQLKSMSIQFINENPS
jgi:hypothetical protein